MLWFLAPNLVVDSSALNASGEMVPRGEKPPRVEPKGTFPGFAGLFARLLARANLVFVGILPSDILGSFSVATAPGAVTTEAPQRRHRQRGRIPDGANRPLSRHGDSDAPFAVEVHSFLR